jgi:hypothetical protein
MTTSLKFFKQYHSTVIKALGEDKESECKSMVDVR